MTPGYIERVKIKRRLRKTEFKSKVALESTKGSEDVEKTIAELHAKIGQLNMENDVFYNKFWKG